MPQRICEQFSGGPTFATSLMRARSGYVQANVDRPDPIFVYEASAFLKDFSMRNELTAFYLALEGMGNTFRFRDMGHYWTGCSVYPGTGDITPSDPATLTSIGTGTGSDFTFQVYVPYVFGAITTLRKITKPAKIDATDNPGYTGPRFWVETGNGTNVWTLITPGSGWVFDYATGIVTFTVAPLSGARVKWAGLFDVHGRWQDDNLVITLLESPEPGQMKIRVVEELT